MILRLLKEVVDGTVRENFNRIENFFRDQPILKGNFEFFEFSLSAAAAGDVRAYVRLGFVPRDVIVTSHTGVGYTLKPAEFTKDYLVVTLAAPGECRLRAFVGTYSEERVV